MRLSTTLSLSLVAVAALAFELPFQVPFFTTHNGTGRVQEPPVTSTAHRVAIIGAGAGGSSAAFWLGLARLRFGHDVEIDVYDKLDYVGGRSTTVYPYENRTLPAVELGASIFVKANRNLWRATDEFNLTRIDFDESGGDGDTGVWDGEKLVLVIRGGGMFTGWLETAKLFWKYGWTSVLRTRTIVSTMIDTFLDLYKKDTPRWREISDLAAKFQWEGMIARSTSEYFQLLGVSRQFTNEMIEGMTRVNYGQNVDEIHGLEGCASLATDGATSVKGGNWQIFEKFLKFSGAKVALNTTVKSLVRKADSSKWSLQTWSGNTAEYSSVILAAPYHSTDLKLSSPALDGSTLAERVPVQPYVHLHVTLLTTTNPNPNPAYFGLPADARAPTAVLTTYDGVRTRDGKEPEFNSLTYHGLVRGEKGTDTEGEEKEWVVKVFSKERISDEWLSEIFEGKVGWVYRKEWDAYPKLPPTESFPAVKLDKGLYYVNSFEPFISTMETETISARNVVDLLLEENFQSGICGARVAVPVRVTPVTWVDAAMWFWTKATAKSDKDFVYGWDC